MNLNLKLFLIITSLLLGASCAFSSDQDTGLELRQSLSKLQWNHKQVAKGDNVTFILKRNDFLQTEIVQMLKNKHLPKQFTITEKDPYATFKDKQTLYVKFYARYKDVFYVFSKTLNEGAEVHILHNAFQTKIKKISGAINSSLFASLNKKVYGHRIPHRFRDAYIHDYDLRKALRKGAKYSLSYEQMYDGERFIRDGEVLDAELELNGEMIKRKFVHSPFGGGSFVGKSLQDNKKYYSPINYQRISSLFQRSRYHPIRKKRIAHTGVDFALPWGEPVFAVDEAVVIEKAKKRAMGRYVILEHEDGLRSYYSHLSGFAKDLSVGDKVVAGQEIAQIGCTGYCTSPHLHFAIKKNNRYIDPITSFKDLL